MIPLLYQLSYAATFSIIPDAETFFHSFRHPRSRQRELGTPLEYAIGPERGPHDAPIDVPDALQHGVGFLASLRPSDVLARPDAERLASVARDDVPHHGVFVGHFRTALSAWKPNSISGRTSERKTRRLTVCTVAFVVDFLSVFVGQQERRGLTVVFVIYLGVGDEPELGAVRQVVRGKQPCAGPHRIVVGFLVFVAQVSPLASCVALQVCQAIALVTSKRL